MKIIFLTGLDIWSMKEGMGAPSLYNTIKLYIDRSDNVVLLKPTGKYHSEYTIEGLKVVTFNNDIFDHLSRIKKISFFGRILSQIYITEMFLHFAKDEILSTNELCVLYAYEVNGVIAAKLLSDKYHIPFITRFQGTVLYDKKDSFFNRLRWYPHYEAISQKSNMVIMTNDGTYGNRVLQELKNDTSPMMFWRNGVEFHINQDCNLKYERKLQRRKWNISEDCFVFMTLSRLASWKRIDRAIRAFQNVVVANPNCKLVIVGEGDMRASLENLSIECGVSDKVVFVGGVQQEETWKCYNATDVFLSLYDLGNMGNPLFEALFWSKPIITLNNGDTASIIKNEYNALMLPPGRDDLIPKAMIRLIEDSNLRTNLSSNAKNYADNNLWTWEERMDAEYQSVTQMVREFYHK